MADTNNTELFKYLRLYLGQDSWNLLRKITPKELKMFQKVDINTDISYFVKGNQDILMKFKAFYLTRCVKKKSLYTQCSIYDYAEGFSTADNDEFGLSVSKDLLFLYMHCHITDLGRSRQWLTSTVINKIADRNRIGLVTVLLSEISVSEFETCGEMKVVDFGAIATADILENMDTGGSSTSKGYGTSI